MGQNKQVSENLFIKLGGKHRKTNYLSKVEWRFRKSNVVKLHYMNFNNLLHRVALNRDFTVIYVFAFFPQLLLLQESWKDLFLLHLSQWAVPWDLANLLNTRQTSLRTNGHILPIEEEVFDMEVKTMQVNEHLKVRKCQK